MGKGQAKEGKASKEEKEKEKTKSLDRTNSPNKEEKAKKAETTNHAEDGVKGPSNTEQADEEKKTERSCTDEENKSKGDSDSNSVSAENSAAISEKTSGTTDETRASEKKTEEHKKEKGSKHRETRKEKHKEREKHKEKEKHKETSETQEKKGEEDKAKKEKESNKSEEKGKEDKPAEKEKEKESVTKTTEKEKETKSDKEEKEKTKEKKKEKQHEKEKEKEAEKKEKEEKSQKHDHKEESDEHSKTTGVLKFFRRVEHKTTQDYEDGPRRPQSPRDRKMEAKSPRKQAKEESAAKSPRSNPESPKKEHPAPAVTKEEKSSEEHEEQDMEENDEESKPEAKDPESEPKELEHTLSKKKSAEGKKEEKKKSGFGFLRSLKEHVGSGQKSNASEEIKPVSSKPVSTEENLPPELKQAMEQDRERKKSRTFVSIEHSANAPNTANSSATKKPKKNAKKKKKKEETVIRREKSLPNPDEKVDNTTDPAAAKGKEESAVASTETSATTEPNVDEKKAESATTEENAESNANKKIEEPLNQSKPQENLAADNKPKSGEDAKAETGSQAPKEEVKEGEKEENQELSLNSAAKSKSLDSDKSEPKTPTPTPVIIASNPSASGESRARQLAKQFAQASEQDKIDRRRSVNVTAEIGNKSEFQKRLQMFSRKSETPPKDELARTLSPTSAAKAAAAAKNEQTKDLPNSADETTTSKPPATEETKPDEKKPEETTPSLQVSEPQKEAKQEETPVEPKEEAVQEKAATVKEPEESPEKSAEKSDSSSTTGSGTPAEPTATSEAAGEPNVTEASKQTSEAAPISLTSSSPFNVAMPSSTIGEAETISRARVSDGPERERLLVLQEVINTERDYINDLKTVVILYITPLSSGKLLAPEQIETLFSNIETILETNEKVLKDFDDRLIEKKDVDILIGDIFLNMAGHFKLYTAYCINQDAQNKLYQQLKETNHKFAQYCAMVKNDEMCRRLELPDLLIKPLQRLCKYPLLLRELLKKTDEHNPDYKNLVDARDKICEVVAYVNERKRVGENQAKIVDIQHSIENCGRLLESHRRFIRNGFITVIDAKGKHKRNLYLFNDVILLSREKKGIILHASTTQPTANAEEELKTEIFVDLLPLKDSRVIDQADSPEAKNCFQITPKVQMGIKPPYLVSCASPDEKRSWLKDIKTMVKEHQRAEYLANKDRMLKEAADREARRQAFLALNRTDAQPTPEQNQDVWAMGLLLYYMYTGKQVFEGLTFAQAAIAYMTKTYQPLLDDEARKTIPREVLELIEDCWLENTDARPNFSMLYDRIQLLELEYPPNAASNNKAATPVLRTNNSSNSSSNDLQSQKKRKAGSMSGDRKPPGSS